MKFDAYEYIGVIVPGALPVVTLTILYPDLMPSLNSSLSVGDLSLLLIFAFIGGHLLQAFGNFWETIVWFFLGGMPTSWVANPKTSLLTSAQLLRLDSRMEADFNVTRIALREGQGPMREIFVYIRQRGKSDRIEKFNRNYGLMRGLAVGFLVAAILVLLSDPSVYWRNAIELSALASVATYRMIRFGIHYAREVFVEYLNLPTAYTHGGQESQGSAT